MPDLLQQLDTLADRLETLPLAVRQEVVFQVQRFQVLLLEFNKDYLQKQGERPDGAPISSKPYSPAYAAFKKRYGKYTNTAFVDLKFSGDFLDSFVLEYDGNLTFRIVATDKKADLLKKYGELLGIRDTDLNDFVGQILEPEIRAFVERYVNQ